MGTAGVGSQLAELANGTLTDATSAFSLLEAVRFAKLHVTKVLATITARRGIVEAEIAGARAPARVRPGRLVTVRLNVRMYPGSLKTIAFRIRIPRGMHGRMIVKIKGPDVPQSLLPGGSGGGPTGGGVGPGGGGGGSGAGGGGGSGANGGGSGAGTGAPAPTSLSELRAMVAQIGPYDGLTLSARGRHFAHYRDPALLIAGSASLRFLVR